MRSQFKVLCVVSAGTLALTWSPSSRLHQAAIAAVSPPTDAATATVTSEICAYEKKLFERTFDGEPNERRLDRLESFIFGAKNSGSAPTRIGKIAAVVPLPATPPAAPKSSSTSSTAGSNSAHKPAAPAGEEPLLDSPGNYPHITALEGEMLGQTYEGHSLNDRLSRLETKAFGAPSKSNDFEERTDAIDQYQQSRRIPKPMTIGHPNDLGVGPLAEEARHADDADVDPGDIVRRETIQQELAVAKRSTPPSNEERTLNRIAWCEQQVFGHASPELHLLQRLHQLNHELFPNDKEKDIQLMDRIDVIVKAVVLKNHPHQPGS